MTFANTLAEQLAERTRRARTPDLAIEDWRLVVDTGTSVEIGLKDNHLGGPYDAPNMVTGTRGEAYVRWADGRISTGTVDRTTLENLDEDLALWRQAAFEDPDAAPVLGPQDVPEVPIYDAGAAALVKNDQAPLFAMLERYLSELPAYEAERVSGSATASINERHLITSQGLTATSLGTSVGTYADVDRRAYDYLSLRRLPTEEELARLIAELGRANRLLRQEASLSPGPQAILFMPPATDAMVGKFIMSNLDGSRVLNGSGAFALEDFRAHAAAFHPTFGLTVDPLRPLSPGSYALTREGVPARRQALIARGRLETPLLDLKHAHRSGLAATPFPRGASSLVLDGPSRPVKELIAGMERGLVVYQMLGLHTQDSTRANFSLTVSQGLVVEGGQVRGHAKAIIAGNFLAALREPFELGTVAGKDTPALLIHGDVTPG